MRNLITIFILCFGIISNAQTKNFQKVSDQNLIAQKINKASINTKSIDSDFKQYKHLDILEDDIESSGHFSFQASDKVRWEYFTPYEYLIIMNSGMMWINDGNKTQKFDTKSNKMFKEINDLMVGMLQGNILESEKFNTIFFENNTSILAKLKPLTPEMKDFLSEINLYFDKKNLTVSKIKMNEHSGDYTLIEFYNKKINIDIPKSKFVLH